MLLYPAVLYWRHVEHTFYFLLKRTKVQTRTNSEEGPFPNLPLKKGSRKILLLARPVGYTQYYELAEDYLSLVRVYCYCDNLSKAAEIANASGDRAACYHLARQYENIDNITEAIHFFTKAQVKDA